MWRKFETLLSALLLLVMVAVGALQVLVRYLPQAGFDFFWTEEASRLLLVWLTFWGATALQRTNDHMVLSVFVDALPKSVQRAILVLVDIAVAIVLGFLAWYGWVAAQLTFAQQTVGLGVSLAAFAFPVSLAAGVMLAYTLSGLWRRLNGRPTASAIEEA